MGWKEFAESLRIPLLKCGSLCALIEREVFTSGEFITGIVLLTVERPANDVELCVWLRCVERVHSEYEDSDSTVKVKRERPVAVTKVILSSSSPVACDVEVPFAVEVPPGLHGTTEIYYASESGRLKAKLQVFYTLTAELTVKEPGFAKSVYSTMIRVLPPPTARSVGKIVEQSVTKNFSYALWFKKSYCNVRVQLDTDVFSLGSTISARVWLDSATPERLKWITLSLVRCIDGDINNVFAHPRDRQAIRSIRFTKDDLGGGSEFMLRLEVLSAASKYERDPLKPTSTFFHVAITYLVEVTTKMRGTRPIIVEIPVLVEPPQLAINSIRISKASSAEAKELILNVNETHSPSATFNHVDINFLVAVTTKCQGSRPIIGRLPVTIEPPEADAGPVAKFFVSFSD